jgi:hypothetical protein
MKKIIGSLAICVAIVAMLSILMVEIQAANCNICGASAECSSPTCYQYKALGFWRCSYTIAHPNAGHKCYFLGDPYVDCQNNTNVLCGISKAKLCSGPPALPDCEGASDETVIRTAGCPD